METVLLEQFVGQNVGDCCLEQLLSYGQVSAVYRAQQLTPNRPVTFMLLFPEGLPTQAHQQFHMRFLREVPALAEIRHPHLLPLYAYGEWEGFAYLVTPILPERSLATILRQQRFCAPTTALTILEQITAGLEYAHCRGLVHGALALSHLLVLENQQIQIAGLGLQHLLEKRDILPVSASYEQVLTVAGTWFDAPRYMAPECTRQGQAADIRSDVYSLGVILCELLTGAPPWREASSLEAVMEQGQQQLVMRPMQAGHLPPTLERLLHQALAVAPSKRFQRVSDLLAAFAEGLDAERSSMATNCWLCPLLPPMETTELQAREDESLAPAIVPWEVSHAMTSVEIPSLPSASQPGQWHTRRLSARQPAVARRGRLHAHQSRKMSRRRLLGLLTKGVAFGGLGVSTVTTGYLLTTALLKRPSPHGAGSSHQQQALNTSQVFTNPRDGRQALLVHLPDGTFVAYERACTHSGVYVDYDGKTHMLVCPAHGAIFDPAHGGRVIQGPASRPLPQVPIRTKSGEIILVDEGEPPSSGQ